MFQATADYNGSKPTISLETGDVLSAVHAVDDTWYIGHNDRSGETGAFPAAFVQSAQDTDCKHLSEVLQAPRLYEDAKYVSKAKEILNPRPAHGIDMNEFHAITTSRPQELGVNTACDNDAESDDKRIAGANSVRNMRDATHGKVLKQIKTSTKPSVPTVRFVSKKLKPSLRTKTSHATSAEDVNQSSNYDQYCAEYGVTIGSRENLTGKLSALKTSTENLIASERDEKRCIKAILGILGGLLLGACILVIYRYIFGYSFEEVGIIVPIITLLMCICLALSSFLRHVMLLVIPNFFTGTGRAVMLSAIFALILQYPVSNISHNAKETGSSMSCIIGIAVNQSIILQRQLAGSIQDITEYVDKQDNYLRKPAEEIHNAVNNVNDLLYTITKGASSADAETAVLRETCRKVARDVKSKCIQTCDDASFSLTNVCGDGVCDGLVSLSDCDTLLFNGSLYAAREARNGLQAAVTFFDVDIEFSGYFYGDVNATQSGDIQQQVDEEIRAMFEVFYTITSIILKCLPLPLLILIIVQSIWYLRNYLAKDGYDNVYITSQFERLDKFAGGKSILPLKKREQNIYVNTRSIKLNKNELSYCWIGLVQVALHFLVWVFVTVFDYALYYILLLVKQHGGIQLDINSDSNLTVQVQGSGLAADFYRIMVEGYEHDGTFNSSIDIDQCLPDPKEPNDWMVPVFIILYVITVAVVILRAYGMRLRRKCAANYCPEQEKARIDYLHKRIRHKRIGFLKFIRQQIMSTHKKSEVMNRLSVSTWLTARFPLFESILPKKQKLECTSCLQQETSFNNVVITRCAGMTRSHKRCSASYCRECLEALQNVCPLCPDEEDVRRRE